MGPPKQVVLDTSIFVGLVDSRDVWHSSAITLRDALKEEAGRLEGIRRKFSDGIRLEGIRGKGEKGGGGGG